MSVARRVLQAITDEVNDRATALESLAGGTVSVVVKLDAAGCPRKVSLIVETERVVERCWPKRTEDR